MAARRARVLVHPAPRARHRSRRGSGVRPGRVVPPPRQQPRRRPARTVGCLRGQPDHRELPVDLGRWAVGHGPRAEGRRRGVAALPAQPGRGVRLAAGGRHRGQVHPRRVRWRLVVPVVGEGRAARTGASVGPGRRRQPVADAFVVVPSGPVTIEEIAATDTRLWVADIDGGPSAIRCFDHDGNALPEVALPATCSVDPLVELGADQVAWAVETFVSPRQWWVQGDDDPQARRTALDTVTPVDFTDIEVERLFATSKDGTRVPINLLTQQGHTQGRLGAHGALWVRRIRDLPQAVVRTLLAAVAGARWRPRGGEHPRRRRVRPGVAPRRPTRHQAELLRRLHRLRRAPRRDRRDDPRPARPDGRLQRRPARGGGAHPATRPRRPRSCARCRCSTRCAASSPRTAPST